MQNKKDEYRQQVSQEFADLMEQFFSVRCRYEAAVREVRTKLEVLDLEFQMKHSRNPIHHMQSRLKHKFLSLRNNLSLAETEFPQLKNLLYTEDFLFLS